MSEALSPPALTRRSIFGALAAAPIALAVAPIALAVAPIALIPASTASASPRYWEAACAEVERASDEFCKVLAAQDEAEDGWRAAKPERPGGALFAAGATVESYNAKRRAEERAFQAKEIECRKRFSIDWHEAEAARAGDARARALDHAIATPAPHVAAIVAKIELGVDNGLELAAVAEAIIADLRRLALAS